MELEGRNTYLQCCQCGRVFHVNETYAIDKLYIKEQCPYCEHREAINLDESKDDKYLYMDINRDQRYYY